MVCKHLTCGERIYPHCRNRSAFQRPHYIERISVVRWHMVHTFNCSTSRQRQLDLCEFENPAWPTEQVLGQSKLYSEASSTEYRTNNRPPLKLSLLCQVGGSLKTQEAGKRLQTLTQQLNWLFQTSVGRHSGNGVSAKGEGDPWGYMGDFRNTTPGAISRPAVSLSWSCQSKQGHFIFRNCFAQLSRCESQSVTEFGNGVST